MAFFFLARSWALRSCAHLLCRWWDPPGNARDFWKFWDASALKRCRFHGVDRFLASNRVHTSGVSRTCEGYRSRSKKLMASPTLDGPTCKAVASSVQKGRSDTHKHTWSFDDTGWYRTVPFPLVCTCQVPWRVHSYHMPPSGPQGRRCRRFWWAWLQLHGWPREDEWKMNGSSNGLSLVESSQTCSKSQLGSLSIFLESGTAKKIWYV